MFLKKKIKCPYCQEILEKKPSRKTKCLFCKKDIYVRNQELVTEERANIIDALKVLDYTNKQFEEHEEMLTKKFGFKQNYVDVILNIFNENILKGIQGDYYQMALLLNKKGRKFFHILQISVKIQLEEFKKMGIKKVEIVSGDDCPSCKELEGRTLSIEDALKEMPIPNKNCTFVLHEGKEPFCTCMYVSAE